jgi:Signal transduction histidine kinase
MKKYTLLLLLCLFSHLNLTGKNVHYQTLGNKHGLSQSSAVSIWQDGIGRMWIGNDALNCYDGESVRVFRISEYINGIEDSDIHALCGNDSALFFLAENRPVCFDLIMETFHSPEIKTYSICHSNGQLYYVSDRGIFSAYDWKADTSYYLVTLPQHIAGAETILEAGKETFWAGTPSGIYIINTASNRIENTLLSDKHIIYLYKDLKDYIWIVTQTHEIYLYTPDQRLIPLKIKNKLIESLFNNSIFCILEDIKGTIHIGTLTGIYELQRTEEDHFLFQGHTLPESTIYALYSDKQGTVWIGSYYGDVRYFNPKEDNYTYYITNESDPTQLHGAVIGQIAEDHKNNLYFATEGSGINILRPGSTRFEHLTTANGLPQNKIKDLWYDKKHNRLIISAYMEGICYLDLNTNTIHRIKNGAITTLHQQIVEKMIPYRNYLVLHTQNGIFKLDRDTLEISRFFDDEELAEFCSGILRTIFIDNKDILWISSLRHGLFTVDLKTNKILKQYGDGVIEKSKIPSAIIKIAEDTQKGLYFVTLKSGILKHDALQDTFLLFNEKSHLLLSNICYNIAFSPGGNLIVVSTKGISLFDVNNNNFRPIHHIRIGASSPLTAFIGDCGLYVSPTNNCIYAGGLYGLLCFNEKDLSNGTGNYSLYFSSLQINNQPTQPGSPLLEKSFPQITRLVLPYNQNTLSFNFATSNYLSSRTSLYEYKLEGLDDSWTKTNHQTIIYNSLRPGKYKLKIREVVNPEKSTELNIEIKPPFWATVPAFLIYIFLFIFSLWRIIRFNKSKSILAASLEMERREIMRIEEMNRNKMDFFVNISNEFRIPLTLILSQLDRLEQDISSISKNKIEKIKRQALRLQELISEMLDFRKMEQNKLSLKIGNHNMVEFLQGIYTIFNDYASEKQVAFKFNHTGESVQVWFNHKQMQKVFFNLLSFIFKTASPKDSIILSLHKVTGYVKVHITHRGAAGPPDEELCNLLDKFNSNNNTFPDNLSSLPDGAIGIAFSNGIINLHKGYLSSIREGDKTVLVVALPSGNAHINLEDIIETSKEEFALPAIVSDELVKEDPFWKDESDNPKKNFRMLLVENDYEMRMLLKETFSMLYEVIEYEEAQEAYEYAIRELPDIILSEINLPGMSGTEMCSMIKSNINTFYIPVVLLSSQPSEEQNIESIRSGADYYFVKPFNTRIFFLRCNYLVKSRHKMLKNKPFEDTNEMLEMVTNEQEQEFLSQVNQVVENHWDDPSFDITIWSKELGISRTRFFNRIKEITGMTPNDYLLLLKMNKGRILLQEGNGLTIAEIAYQLGFRNPAYFSKCFKKQFGITPQNIKRNNKPPIKKDLS